MDRRFKILIGVILVIPLLLFLYTQYENRYLAILEGTKGLHDDQLDAQTKHVAIVPKHQNNHLFTPTNDLAIVPIQHQRDYLTENEAMDGSILTDSKMTVSLLTSSVTLIGHRKSYSVGEDILLSITLRNGYNVTRTRGGDQLRVRIFNESMKAFAPGHVIDHKNGSYTAVVSAMWPGKQTISLRLAYRREKIRAIYYMRQQLSATRNIAAIFISGSKREQTRCHPDRDWLSNYPDVCNFTLMNGGASWYCGKPKDRVLLCEDWTKTKVEQPYPIMPITSVENKILWDKAGDVFPSISVDISGPRTDRNRLPACYSYPRKHLWNNHKPSGYFFNNTWYLNHCNAPLTPDIQKCMRNTHLMISGDSTSRAWYKYIHSVYLCKTFTGNWTNVKWHKRSACEIPAINFTMEWLPHGQPFAVGIDGDVNKYTLNALTRQINEIPNDQKVVYVVHMLMHVLAYHHSVFRDRMRLVSKSIKHLVNRNKHAVVVIKGPHTFIDTPAGVQRLSDYFGYVYRDIIFQEFKDLHDRVVYMDQKDMTISKDVHPNHPQKEVIEAAVNQMFAYICQSQDQSGI